MNSAEAAYRALVVRKNPDRSFAASVESLRAAELPAGEVTVRGRWSSLNYKDALSISGHPGITRTFPHVPGIDVAGNVVASTSTDFAPGAEVIVTGFEFGSQRWGGYAELTRVPAEWVVPLPPGLTAREAMVLGTAGFTAAQCVQALQHEGVAPSDGPIAVTGASGGVGTLAVALLARLGYRVSAVSGKPAAHNLLKQLGAAEILSRDAVEDSSDKPLLAVRWAGVVDTVGGNTLATLIRTTNIGGCVTACGLVGGTDLKLTVYPFILRGVRLIGIDSAWVPQPRRAEIWAKLAGPWKLTGLETLTHELSLPAVAAAAQEMLAGRTLGRSVVRIE